MKLAIPDLSARITSINNMSPGEADTLSALSNVVMQGDIYDELTEQTQTEFDGIVDIEIFDSESIKETLGSKTPVMQYGEWDNAIYRGKATVTSGQFEFEFTVPKNITYQYNLGRVNLYAQPESGFQDAGGGLIQLAVGGSTDEYVPDDMPPSISLFMEDSSFTDGSLTGSNTRLVAYFSDESGMNISGRGLGQKMVAILDGMVEYDLSDYFTSFVDDYTTGVAILPIRGLSKGIHNITVKAFDTQNNGSEAFISFRVEDSDSFIVEELRNYPNPFSENTTFGFSHNRAGEDLDILLHIYSLKGEVVKEIRWDLENSPAFINQLTWDGRNSSGKKLSEGIYFYRLVVRSNKDGAKTQDYKKLVLIN